MPPKNVLIVILTSIGIVILAIIIGFFLYTPVDEQKIIEIVDWETYRNEKYRIEINYPVNDWEFIKGSSQEPFFSLCKKNSCINSGVIDLVPSCKDSMWEEIIENAYDCFLPPEFSMGQFKGKIVTEFKVEGYRGEIKTVTENFMRFPPGKDFLATFFPLEKDDDDVDTLPILILYWDLAIDYTQEEIDTFNQVVSTFRFIEK